MKQIRRMIGGLILVALLGSANAQIAQEPLLNRPTSVTPNMVLILDTSGSMDSARIYEYGAPGDIGPSGPNTQTYALHSPQVNRLAYDPRVRYLPRVSPSGVTMPDATPTTSNWNVYFLLPGYVGNPYTADGPLSTAAAYWSPTYVPVSGSAVAGNTSTYPQQVVWNVPNQWFPKFVNRTDCAGATRCTLQEERQNHANWNTWYRTRALMAQTGIGRAINEIADGSIRLGYGTIRDLSDFERLARGVSTLQSGSAGSKEQFLTWLYGQSFGGGTPNRRAVSAVGRYFSRTDSDGPWATIPDPRSTVTFTVGTPVGPGAAEPPLHHASCRRSFSLLVTDGYWNDGSAPSGIGDADSQTYTHERPTGQLEVHPRAELRNLHADPASVTLADVAMKFWGSDLRPDLPNRVPPIDSPRVRNDSFWQNNSFYAVTLGLLGSLPRTTTVLADLKDARRQWPAPAANTYTTIDDTWHATINGHGELINANNGSELTDAIRSMMESIAGTPQTLSGVAVSAISLQAGTRKFKPQYVPGTWSGQLTAVDLDPVTGDEQAVRWRVEKGMTSAQEPDSMIPRSDQRFVWTWNGAQGVPFNALTTGFDANLINYLKGDSSRELRKPGGVYRNRSTKLGDIVNSTPAFVKGNVDLRYEKLLPANAFGNYRDYVLTKSWRNEGVLFVGANDGMLHAFREENGAEIFAFVPEAVLPHLPQLASVPYQHRYFVDGPNVETDAYWDNGWRNLVLGTAGAGAKSIYAIDVSNPLSLGASSILWEINTSRPNFGQLGHVLSEVQAGILQSNHWVALFGNGFGSEDGIARLYVVNLRTGELLQEVSTGVGGGNGLGGVTPVFDANRRIIGAYAGDLKGNLWKFDLTGPQGSWRLGLNGSPLITTDTNASKPITAAPTVLPHTTGYVVSFGTGKFFQPVDAGPPYAPQRLYGVWDAQPFGATSTPDGASRVALNQLVPQTITHGTGAAAPYIQISTNAVVWGGGTSGVRGWYMDLPHAGERLVYPLRRLNGGTFLLAGTLSPESAVTGPDVCSATGTGSAWGYIFDGVTGSGPTQPTLDTNNDNLIDASDGVFSGFVDVMDGQSSVISIIASETVNRGCIGSAQADCRLFQITCGQVGASACGSAARFRSRSWRQLFLR